MKRNNIKEKLKKHFLMNPTKKMRVREIEREVNIPLPSAIKYSEELMKEKILKKVKISNITYYTANTEAFEFSLAKKLLNILLLYESGLVEHIRQEYSNPAIVLFGSFAKGEDVEESDIDLFIETPLKVGDLSKFENALKHKIQVFSYKNIKLVENKELANNILNGIVLNGYLEAL